MAAAISDEDPLSYTLPNFVPRRSNELKTQVPYEVTVDLLCYSNSVTCDVKMLENEKDGIRTSSRAWFV